MRNDLDELVATTAAKHAFSGAVQVTIDRATVLAEAFGEADRSAGIRNTVDTRFGIASGTKFLTALAAGALIDDGKLALEDRLVDLVSVPLPGVSAAVTIGHLLTHTSGVYDYLDEDVIDDPDHFELPIPPFKLLGPRDYLPMLVAGPAKFEPGTRFSYSNGGFVLLGFALEEVAGCSFHALVEERVLRPCGMTDSGFFRFDRLPPRVANGYVETSGGGWRTNIYSLPIIGGPDGGMFTTVGDFDRLWRGFFDGAVLSSGLASMFLKKAATQIDKQHSFYGHGIWIHDDGASPPLHYIIGGDAGVSFRSSAHSDATFATVVSNTSNGAWP
ncbi:MAG TPA: serine hydrolase domain-containing protein, partial [Candidatus Eisenbacteria bacterium]|nr:serine hydrolase domain-containing protein [Candidatus Eisenbacteria bacterium]